MSRYKKIVRALGAKKASEVALVLDAIQNNDGVFKYDKVL